MSSFKHYHVTNHLQYPVMKDTQDPEEGSFLQNMKDNVKFEIISLNGNDLVFDLIGADVSIANALRRIFIAEVPTVAIEKVFIDENTSIVQDEVLSHRLGLIPLDVDPTLLEDVVPGEESNLDTIALTLDVECPYNADSSSDRVHSGHLTYNPTDQDQEKMFPNGVKPVHEDILIAQLAPGQRIQLTCYAHRGVGKDHAKFSPVATASYRLLPNIVLNESIVGRDAEELKATCPMNVFDIEDSRAVVARPRKCTMCRECIRTGKFTDRVSLLRVADHFEFSVESTGAIRPTEIVRRGIAILKKKAMTFSKIIVEYEKEQGGL